MIRRIFNKKLEISQGKLKEEQKLNKGEYRRKLCFKKCVSTENVFFLDLVGVHTNVILSSSLNLKIYKCVRVCKIQT